MIESKIDDEGYNKSVKSPGEREREGGIGKWYRDNEEKEKHYI